MRLVSITFETTNNFEKNLLVAKKYIKKTDKNSFILLPELCFSGYSYDRLDEASIFTDKILKELLQLSKDKFIAFSAITKKQNHFFNTLYLLHSNKIIHTQSKNKLFVLNEEKKFFTSGDEKDIKIVDINNLKIGFLICFELRFVEFWEKLKGCDIIAIPAMWGKPRKNHLITLSKSLAILNQCFVIVSNSKNEDMAKSSAIIDPFGNELRDDRKNILNKQFDNKTIKKMRKYMNIGLK